MFAIANFSRFIMVLAYIERLVRTAMAAFTSFALDAMTLAFYLSWKSLDPHISFSRLPHIPFTVFMPTGPPVRHFTVACSLPWLFQKSWRRFFRSGEQRSVRIFCGEGGQMADGS
jgi:hypothetical protein